MEKGKDISNEKYRRYEFYEGEPLVILEPKTLWVSENGHRIETKDGKGFYIFIVSIKLIEWSVHDETKVMEY
jgi:hypothetical protein